jgi:hypothetical protein
MSPEGCPVRCVGWAMNEIPNIDHIAVAALIARRWQEDRPYFTLNRKARGPWLEGSWRWQPANNALELHWSRRFSAPPMQTGFTCTGATRNRVEVIQ